MKINGENNNLQRTRNSWQIEFLEKLKTVQEFRRRPAKIEVINETSSDCNYMNIRLRL